MVLKKEESISLEDLVLDDAIFDGVINIKGASIQDSGSGKKFTPDSNEMGLYNKLQDKRDNIYSANAVKEHIDHLPLYLKRTNQGAFQNGQYVDADVKAHCSHFFSKEYPDAAAYADYGNFGVSDGREVSIKDRIAKTLINQKWGFYHFASPGHWVTLAISPDREVLCLDSLNSSNNSKHKLIQDNIIEAFDFARSYDKDVPEFKVSQIQYKSTGTQVGVQCGLHSCVAMEEVLKSVCANDKKHSTESLHRVIALEELSTSDFSYRDKKYEDGSFFKSLIDRTLNSVTGNHDYSFNVVTLELLLRAVESLDKEEKNHLKKCFKLEENQDINADNLSKLSFDQRYDISNQADELGKYFSKRHKQAVKEIMPDNFRNTRAVLERANDENDPIRQKPSHDEIFDARWNASSFQIGEQRLTMMQEIRDKMKNEVKDEVKEKQFADINKRIIQLSADDRGVHTLENMSSSMGNRFIASTPTPSAEESLAEENHRRENDNNTQEGGDKLLEAEIARYKTLSDELQGLLISNKNECKDNTYTYYTKEFTLTLYEFSEKGLVLSGPGGFQVNGPLSLENLRLELDSVKKDLGLDVTESQEQEKGNSAEYSKQCELLRECCKDYSGGEYTLPDLYEYTHEKIKTSYDFSNSNGHVQQKTGSGEFENMSCDDLVEQQGIILSLNQVQVKGKSDLAEKMQNDLVSLKSINNSIEEDGVYSLTISEYENAYYQFVDNACYIQKGSVYHKDVPITLATIEELKSGIESVEKFLEEEGEKNNEYKALRDEFRELLKGNETEGVENQYTVNRDKGKENEIHYYFSSEGEVGSRVGEFILNYTLNIEELKQALEDTKELLKQSGKDDKEKEKSSIDNDTTNTTEDLDKVKLVKKMRDLLSASVYEKDDEDNYSLVENGESVKYRFTGDNQVKISKKTIYEDEDEDVDVDVWCSIVNLSEEIKKLEKQKDSSSHDIPKPHESEEVILVKKMRELLSASTNVKVDENSYEFDVDGFTITYSFKNDNMVEKWKEDSGAEDKNTVRNTIDLRTADQLTLEIEELEKNLIKAKPAVPFKNTPTTSQGQETGEKPIVNTSSENKDASTSEKISKIEYPEALKPIFDQNVEKTNRDNKVISDTEKENNRQKFKGYVNKKYGQELKVEEKTLELVDKALQEQNMVFSNKLKNALDKLPTPLGDGNMAEQNQVEIWRSLTTLDRRILVDYYNKAEAKDGNKIKYNDLYKVSSNCDLDKENPNFEKSELTFDRKKHVLNLDEKGENSDVNKILIHARTFIPIEIIRNPKATPLQNIEKSNSK